MSQCAAAVGLIEADAEDHLLLPVRAGPSGMLLFNPGDVKEPEDVLREDTARQSPVIKRTVFPAHGFYP